MRIARDVVLRRAAQRDQRHGDEPERGEQQQRVQAQPPLARARAGAAARRPAGWWTWRSSRLAGARVELVVGQMEPLGEDQARRGCRSLRTEPAASRSSSRRRSGASDGRRRRRTRTGRDWARARPCRSCRRSGYGKPRNTSADVPPSAVAAACRPSMIACRLPGSNSTRRRAGLRISSTRRPRAVLDRQPEVRAHHAAAVGDRRVGGRELERRRLEVALADREVDVVARGPRPLDAAAGVQRLGRAGGHLGLLDALGVLGVALVAPLAVGHQALELAGDVDPGRRPIPSRRAHSWMIGPRALASAPRL